MAKLKLGILISGRGSNLQALIDACAEHDFPAEIALVISNQADAYGLTRAAEANILTRVLNHKDYKTRELYDAALDAALVAAGVQMICLAGFMRLLSSWFVTRWLDRLINIHPSLLPSFKGLETHAAALKAGVKIHGCSVHFVRPALDDGPIIVQAAVPVLENDTIETLAARVSTAEHETYPLAVRLIADRRVNIVAERCFISGTHDFSHPLIAPGV